MPAMRAPIRPFEKPKQQEGKIISWDLDRSNYHNLWNKKKIHEQMIDQVMKLARQAGYMPPHIVYALAALKIPKTVAKEILTEIFEAQGHNKTKAEQMAQTQIDVLWDTSMRKIDIADNKPKR